jgi:hypothetical protein
MTFGRTSSITQKRGMVRRQKIRAYTARNHRIVWDLPRLDQGFLVSARVRDPLGTGDDGVPSVRRLHDHHGRKAPAVGVGDANGLIKARPARRAIHRASPESVNESARAGGPTTQTAIVIVRATETIRIDNPHTASHQPPPRPHVNLEHAWMNRALVAPVIRCVRHTERDNADAAPDQGLCNTLLLVIHSCSYVYLTHPRMRT